MSLVISETVAIEDRCQESAIVGSPYARTRSVFALDPLRDARWTDLIKRSPSSSVFHSREWLSALHVAYGYEPVVYTSCDPFAELTSGIIFCKVRSWLTGRRLVSLPFSDHCDPLVETYAEFDELLLSLRESVDGEGWNYCEVRPLRLEPDVATMFGATDRYCWHAIDLRPHIDDIFRRFHKNGVQRKIRRAERERLSVEEGNSERLLGHFYRLLVETRRRQHYPPQPIRWFRSLIASFGDNLRIRVAFKEGLPIASILTLNHKDTMTYKYGCSDARFHALGGVALLFWNTIQQAKTAGYATLDLGRTDSSNQGLITFKDHWGGIPSYLSYWRYPNHPRSHESRWNGRIAGRIIDAAPDRLLTAVGDLFYGHIG